LRSFTFGTRRDDHGEGRPREQVVEF